MDSDFGLSCNPLSLRDELEYHQDHCPNLDELQLQSPLSPLGGSEYQTLLDSPYFTPIMNNMEGKAGRHSPDTVAVHQPKPNARKYNIIGNRQNLRLDIPALMNTRQKKGPVVDNIDEQLYGKGAVHTQNLQTVASVSGLASSPDNDILYTEKSVLLKNSMTGESCRNFSTSIGNLVNNRRPIKQATFTNSIPNINTTRSQAYVHNPLVGMEKSIIMENSQVNIHNTRVDRDPIIKLHHDNNKRKHDDINLIRDNDRVVKLHGGKKPHSDPISAKIMSVSNGVKTNLVQQKSVFSTTDSRNPNGNNIDQLSIVHMTAKNEIQNPDSDQTVYIDQDISYIPVESTSNDNIVNFDNIDLDQLMKDVLESPENIENLNNFNNGCMNALMAIQDPSQITIVEIPVNTGAQGLVNSCDCNVYAVEQGKAALDEKLPSISKQMDSLILQDELEITGEDVIIETPKYPFTLSGKNVKTRQTVQHFLNENQTWTANNYPISVLDEEPFISYDINSHTLACNLMRDSQDLSLNVDDLQILYESDVYNLVGLENIGSETEVESEREVLRYSVEEGQCADMNDGLKQELASISEDQIPEGVENADDKKACDLASCIPYTVEEVANLPDFESLVSEDEDPTVKTEKKEKRKNKEKIPVASKKYASKSFPVEHNHQQHNLKSFQKPLWEFLLDVLANKEHNPSVIKWLEHKKGTFKIVKGAELANLWTRARNRMCDLKYEFFARAIRHYYTKNILRRMPHKKLQYQFHPEFDWRTYDKKITANATK